MKTVAAAIREDLTRVKDVLDIFVRKGATQVDELAPQLEMLRKIGDTLGVLGLGELRGRVQGEIESLQASSTGAMPPDDAALLGIAAALIQVEDSLDAQLVRLILPDAAPRPGARRADRRRSSARCRTRCCASASSTWRASRKRSRRRSARPRKRRASTRCRSSCAASRRAC